MIYRVRKSWEDSKSQIGAYKELENAKKQALKYGYKVYDPKGNVVYNGTTQEVYRVRKTWANINSQLGAYKILDNAKKMCDKHPGYSVYGAKGKKLYTSTIPKTTVAFTKYTFGQNGDSAALKPKYTGTPTYSTSNSNVATVNAKGIIKSIGPGTATIKFNDKTIKVTVPPALSYVKAMAPLVEACKIQADYSYKSNYKWESYPTVPKSKTNGTCVTYVGCVLQRLNILPEGKYIWHNGSGYGTGKITGTLTSNLAAKYLNNKRPSALKNELKLGDVVLHDDNKSGIKGDGGHIEIFADEIGSNGKAKYFSGGYGSGHNTTINGWNNRTILAIVRPKTYSVKTYCVDGTITASSLNLACQNVKVTYTPLSGKKLKQLLIDGKEVDITKYSTSYTFKNISTNHVVKAVFA